MVMMNNEGEADMVKVRPMMIHEGTDLVTPGASPAVVSMVSKVNISERVLKLLKKKDEQRKNDVIYSNSAFAN